MLIKIARLNAILIGGLCYIACGVVYSCSTETCPTGTPGETITKSCCIANGATTAQWDQVSSCEDTTNVTTANSTCPPQNGCQCSDS